MGTAKILILVAYCSIVLAQNNVRLSEIGLHKMLVGNESSIQHLGLDVATNSTNDILIESIGLGNFTLPQIGLTQILTDIEPLTQHVVLEVVTDSPIDLVNKSMDQNNITIPQNGSNLIVLEKHESPEEEAGLTKVTDSPKLSLHTLQANQSVKLSASKQPQLLNQTTIMQHQLLAQPTQSNKVNENISPVFLEHTTPLPVANLNEIPHKNLTNKQNYPLINTITYVITLSTYSNVGKPMFASMPTPSGLLTKLLSGNLPGFPKPVNQHTIPGNYAGTRYTTESLTTAPVVSRNTISMATKK